jgi:NH3-dependent NAD+ synthetase
MCHTTVTIEGETLEMWLPVMDGANKSMKNVSYTYSTKFGDKTVEAATTFDINKTMMRCLVKNLAMFGLGLYIFAGEDLPEDVAEPIVAKPIELIDLKKDSEDWLKVVMYVRANKELGLEKIGAQLVRKYKISPSLKKEISNLINS